MILVSTYFGDNRNQSFCPNITFVHTMKEFKHNLATRFSSDDWLKAIDFSKWIIVGGCVLNALCKSSFLDIEQQDINLVNYKDNLIDFKMSVDTIFDNLYKTVPKDLQNKIKLEIAVDTLDYNIFLPCNIQLNLVCANTENSKEPLSDILHKFDMDICQVAFTGKYMRLLITFSLVLYVF